MLRELIESGRAPVTMLLCIPACATGLEGKECQKCLERALVQGYGKDACKPESKDDKDDDEDDEDDEDDNRSNTPPGCALLSCGDRGCGSGV